jgi:hypothetical protein
MRKGKDVLAASDDELVKYLQSREIMADGLNGDALKKAAMTGRLYVLTFNGRPVAAPPPIPRSVNPLPFPNQDSLNFDYSELCTYPSKEEQEERAKVVFPFTIPIDSVRFCPLG